MLSHAIPGSVADDRHELVGDQKDDGLGHWRDQALCAQADPDLWFPEPGESARTAKLICGWCPVRAECLGWAVETNEPYGIYGGLTPLERHALSIRGADEAEPVGRVA